MSSRRQSLHTVPVLISLILFALMANSCSVGFSTPPLTSTDVADIIAPSVAASTAGDLGILVRLAGAQSRTAEPNGSISFDYGTMDLRTVATDGSATDTTRYSLMAAGEVERSRVRGDFTSRADIDISTSPMGLRDLSEVPVYTAVGSIHRSGSITYENWVRTAVSKLDTDFTASVNDVVITRRGGQAEAPYEAVSGSLTVHGTIFRTGSQRTAVWTGSVTIRFDGSSNASMVFPDGEKKLINLSTGDVVQ